MDNEQLKALLGKILLCIGDCEGVLHEDRWKDYGITEEEQQLAMDCLGEQESQIASVQPQQPDDSQTRQR